MQAAELLKYIKNPALLDKQSTTQLQKLVSDFPYFQTAHLLLSMSSKKWDASVYQQSLKKTAIVATNRAHLFHLIHQLENNIAIEEEKKTFVEEKVIEEKNTKEDQKHELDILKATEVISETKKEEVVTKKTVEPEEVFEKEIKKQVVESLVEKEILKTQEILYPVKTVEQPENFSDWLLFLKKNNGQSYQNIEEKVNEQKGKDLAANNEEIKKAISKKEKNKALIDKIIDTNPGLIRNKEEAKFYSPDNKAKESLIENEHLVTETLAKIYALQGSVNKAVRAYEILSLKFPQKSAYFASLIQKLKNNQ
ncbi:MAG: hypothetical protein H0W73_07295 [Bacteroidetes bacterium]|nr:hypothetical protein [Bacteroidota bacterium]